MSVKEKGALCHAPRKEPAGQYFACASPSTLSRDGREHYGGLDRVLSAIQRLFDAISNSSAAISLWIEQRRWRLADLIDNEDDK
jgi:hypothetical protein